MSDDDSSSDSDNGQEDTRLTNDAAKSTKKQKSTTKKKKKRGSGGAGMMCPNSGGSDNGQTNGNLKIMGGLMKLGIVGISIPAPMVREMGKKVAQLAAKSGVKIGAKGDPAGSSGYAVMLMGVLPNFLWLFLVFGYGVVNMMDAADPSIIDARNRNKWTYTITQSIALFVLGALWFLTDRKYSLHGYSIVFLLFAVWLCELINVCLNNVNQSTYGQWNDVAHNVNSAAAGIAFSAMLEMFSRKYILRKAVSLSDDDQP